MEKFWIDLTVRTAEPAEVSPQPDGTIELSWPAPEAGTSRLTILVSADNFRRLMDEGRDLLMMGRIAPEHS